MRKLFIQFYLLLVVCFLTSVVMIGAVYQKVGDGAGERYLAELLGTALSLIKTELRHIPPEQWAATLEQTKHDFSFPVSISKTSDFTLSDSDRASLAAGDIVMLEKEYLFLQGLPDSRYLLVAGPLQYLFFLHQLKWLDYALIGLIGLSLAIPVLLWMRPLWRDLQSLERASGEIGRYNRDAHVELPPHSGVKRLGDAHNRMVTRIEELLESKKTLTDAVAHELRTPLARIRYRLALLEGEDATCSNIERDLDVVESLLEEMLLHASLDRPQISSALQVLDFAPWAAMHLDNIRVMFPQLDWQLRAQAAPSRVLADARLMGRALDNLLVNAGRHAQQRVILTLGENTDNWWFSVADDGPGVAPEDRARVFEPFVRLDLSRSRDTGGHGLGLAIVADVARTHHGHVILDDSAQGGACFCLSWPRSAELQTVT